MNSYQWASECIEDLELCLGCGAIRVFIFEQTPDHRVAPAVEEARLGAQSAFIREAKLARDRGRCKVLGVAMYFEAVNAHDFKRNFDQRSRGFGHQASVDEVFMDPIANFQLVFTDS